MKIIRETVPYAENQIRFLRQAARQGKEETKERGRRGVTSEQRARGMKMGRDSGSDCTKESDHNPATKVDGGNLEDRCKNPAVYTATRQRFRLVNLSDSFINFGVFLLRVGTCHGFIF